MPPTYSGPCTVPELTPRWQSLVEQPPFGGNLSLHSQLPPESWRHVNQLSPWNDLTHFVSVTCFFLLKSPQYPFGRGKKTRTKLSPSSVVWIHYFVWLWVGAIDSVFCLENWPFMFTNVVFIVCEKKIHLAQYWDYATFKCCKYIFFNAMHLLFTIIKVINQYRLRHHLRTENKMEQHCCQENKMSLKATYDITFLCL